MEESSFDLQVWLSVKPDPPSGSADEVAQSIRVNTGVFTANIGVNWHLFSTNESDDDGTFGLEIRAGLPVSYQRARSTEGDDGGEEDPSATITDFGIFSPELKISCWLKYVLVGYKFNYYLGFGNKSEVYAELDNTSAHKFYLAANISALSGDNSPFYLEATYTTSDDSSDDPSDDGSFAIAFAKKISW